MGQYYQWCITCNCYEYDCHGLEGCIKLEPGYQNATKRYESRQAEKEAKRKEENLNRLRKRLISRERAEEVRRIGMSLDGADEALLIEVADLLLEIRQALKGGRLNVSGGKYWPDGVS